MKKLLTIILLITAALRAQEKVTVTGVVTNAETREPVPYVNILVTGTHEGTAADRDGRFNFLLTQGVHTLKLTSLGYEPVTVKIDAQTSRILAITMKPRAIEFSEEVIIYGQPLERETEMYYLENKLNTTDDVLEKLSGLSMIRRANFALEPSIRGLSAGQINVLVDDMKIFGACIDKMDPVTSYVEIDNLQKLELARGGFEMAYGSTIGGTLNLKTGKPDFTKRLTAGLESGYESASDLRFLRVLSNWSNGNWAARGSFSLKAAGDYYAGNHQLWRRSGFQKTNYKLDLARKWETHALTFSYIGDVATDVGYPALLMDTRRAKAQIAGAEHVWNFPGKNIQSVKTKIYYNTINHRMDDYDRDVTAREFMANMYMPMTGNTETFGVLSQINFAGEKQSLKLVADVYAMQAFADMRMENIDTSVAPMYLVNLAGVHVQNYALSADYRRQLRTDFYWRSLVRLDYSRRTLHDDFGERELEGYWNTRRLNKNYLIPSISTALEYQLSQYDRVRFSLARSARLPSHTENYGFYLYNVSDGFVYTGYPGLKPETSYQSELAMERSNERYAVKANFFYNHIQDYIGGRIEDGQFKTYDNISTAYVAGAEASAYWAMTASLGWMTSASFKYSRVTALDEPIPYMPPLEVMNSFRWTQEKYWFEAYSKTAAPQKRLAKIGANEKTTEGFTVVNLRSGLRIGSFMEWQFGVENVFDKWYHEHSSINRLPARGRNWFATLSVKY